MVCNFLVPKDDLYKKYFYNKKGKKYQNCFQLKFSIWTACSELYIITNHASLNEKAQNVSKNAKSPAHKMATSGLPDLSIQMETTKMPQ